MAYTFDKIKSTLEEDQKQNIFGPESAPSFGLAGTQAKSGSGPVEKAGSTAIKAPSQGGSTAQTPAVTELDQPRGATEARQQALETGGKKAPLPSSLQGLGDSLTEKETTLQSSGEEYLAPFRQTDFGLSGDTLEKATAGDEEAYAKITGLLGSGIPEAPEGFELPTEKELAVPGIKDIQEPGGLEQYLRRQAGPQYTAGEGAFDVATLSRSPAFMQAATQLGGRQAALTEQARQMQGTLPGQAQDILNEQLATAQGDVRTGLEGIRSGLDEQILARLAEAENERLALGLPGRTQTESLLEAVRARKSLADQTPDDQLLDELILSGELGVDPTQFYTARTDPLTRQMVTTEDEANRFNQIMKMLGTSGDPAVAGSLPELSQFDTSGYQQALGDAAMAERIRLDDEAAAAAAEAEAAEVAGRIGSFSPGALGAGVDVALPGLPPPEVPMEATTGAFELPTPTPAVAPPITTPSIIPPPEPVTVTPPLDTSIQTGQLALPFSGTLDEPSFALSNPEMDPYEWAQLQQMLGGFK